MPYITERAKSDLEETGMNPKFFSGPGDLNYAITRLVLEYLPTTPHYADYNSVVGVLESAKLEFYARMVRPYEDKKIKENGDVY
jgi:hypothetical protein